MKTIFLKVAKKYIPASFSVNLIDDEFSLTENVILIVGTPQILAYKIF